MTEVYDLTCIDLELNLIFPLLIALKRILTSNLTLTMGWSIKIAHVGHVITSPFLCMDF